MKKLRSYLFTVNTTLLLILGLIFSGAVAVRWAGPQIEAWLDQYLTSASQEVVSKREVVEEESAVISVVEEVGDSVVSIVVDKVTFSPMVGLERLEEGVGTGFVVGSDGLILTNRHVVSEADANYTVVLKDKQEYPVQEIHRDPFYDLAFLRIDAQNLESIALGDSESIRVGQKVIAIGNALGRFTNTVTTGVVSGIGRGISASGGGKAEVLEDVIQTDAALNPGNSGGPLLDIEGKVIGINVAISPVAENIGFAIPINVAKDVFDNFRAHGRILRPYLGVSYVLVTEDVAKLQELSEGAYIRAVVSDSPADEAGLQAGDIITHFGGEEISEEQSLAVLIREKEVGDVVTLKVVREKRTLTLTTTLGEAPQTQQ
ncbi:MAG: S1C family serine protease [Patescibacteria group bacterium]